MELTLSSGAVVKVMAIDLERGTVDWRRTDGGYTGACSSRVTIGSLDTIKADIENALEGEMSASLTQEPMP